MGLRIPIKICKEDKCLNVIALLNTGFETEEPIISISPSIAEQLGLGIVIDLKRRKRWIT